MMMIVSLSGCTDDSHKPTAKFTIEPLIPKINEPVYLNSTSSDTKYKIETYQWYINKKMMGDQEHLIHTFDQNGSYQISLTITNSEGISDSCLDTLVVGQDNIAKQKLLGSWQWNGNNQIGNWTFYENNTLKSVFTGIYATGEYGSSSVVYWTFLVDGSHLYFSNPTDERLNPAVYSYELLNNDTLLRITYEESTADWYKDT
ncbi:MAG: PKD domain-containing protein [Candidatus Thermoplasmatota archaeon]|nr:PKD domain-containing protein [Candidatus Thermoplasmatota archaeon]